VKSRDDAEVLAPAVRHTRQRKRCADDCEQRLLERQVTVTNPDGTTTEHTFWSDTHID
jgi:hypothetical protein